MVQEHLVRIQALITVAVYCVWVGQLVHVAFMAQALRRRPHMYN